MRKAFWQSGSDCRWFLSKKLKMTLMATETPATNAFMANAIKNFHFVFWTLPLTGMTPTTTVTSSWRVSALPSDWFSIWFVHCGAPDLFTTSNLICSLSHPIQQIVVNCDSGGISQLCYKSGKAGNDLIKKKYF